MPERSSRGLPNKLLIRWVFKAFDLLLGPRLFQLFWHLGTRVTRLTEMELEAASAVFGPSAIRYDSVRIAEGRLLSLVFKRNKSRAFTTFHTINLPYSGHHAREHLNILIHELVHVCQFEVAGSIYIPQGLRAQRSKEGYNYGDPDKLVRDREGGKRYRDYNREQQGKIAEDYYDRVVAQSLPESDTLRQAYEPLMDELRARDL